MKCTTFKQVKWYQTVFLKVTNKKFSHMYAKYPIAFHLTYILFFTLPTGYTIIRFLKNLLGMNGVLLEPSILLHFKIKKKCVFLENVSCEFHQYLRPITWIETSKTIIIIYNYCNNYYKKRFAFTAVFIDPVLPFSILFLHMNNIIFKQHFSILHIYFYNTINYFIKINKRFY